MVEFIVYFFEKLFFEYFLKFTIISPITQLLLLHKLCLLFSALPIRTTHPVKPHFYTLSIHLTRTTTRSRRSR